MTEETQVEPSRDEVVQVEPAPVDAAPEPAPEPVEAPPAPTVETPTSTGFTVWDVATGQIVSFGQCSPYVVAAQAAEGQDYVDAAYDDSLYWMPDGVPTLRPEKPTFATTVTTGQAVTVTGVDDGADVTLTDSYGVSNSFAYDQSDPLVLTEAGTYHIQVRQPFPAHGGFFTIEVTDA